MNVSFWWVDCQAYQILASFDCVHFSSVQLRSVQLVNRSFSTCLLFHPFIRLFVRLCMQPVAMSNEKSSLIFLLIGWKWNAFSLCSLNCCIYFIRSFVVVDLKTITLSDLEKSIVRATKLWQLNSCTISALVVVSIVSILFCCCRDIPLPNHLDFCTLCKAWMHKFQWSKSQFCQRNCRFHEIAWNWLWSIRIEPFRQFSHQFQIWLISKQRAFLNFVKCNQFSGQILKAFMRQLL